MEFKTSIKQCEDGNGESFWVVERARPFSQDGNIIYLPESFYFNEEQSDRPWGAIQKATRYSSNEAAQEAIAAHAMTLAKNDIKIIN